ncbi:MAG TPA: DUF692 domain-containing protein [Gammaproteobacteria bacterium]|nr:DUF692 domain-containing protein [Gammaproteobacteria bacterium]HQZ87184.1 DUF692 domain-containing protein [Gammaproteobacteria bacterium]HRA43119.1 DUF692 domain-containing protein [Gammaproteobacteria bacterium]
MLGFGLGLRTDHYSSILDTRPQIDWFEILSENYMISGGKPLYFLDQIREHYPMAMHGVSLSIGNTDSLNWDYLKQLKDLAVRVKPAWISDHLCWTGINKQNIHDLLPLPYTTETIEHVVLRVKAVQDFLGQQILLENVSSYITFKNSELSEWDFLSAIAIEADCKILLDINNIYVNSFNHGFDPYQYLEGLPCDRIQQFHLAGHTHNVDHIIDTHNAPIVDPVWQLYAAAIKRFGRTATLIERDDNIPPLNELLTELKKAKAIAEQNYGAVQK